MVEICQFPPIPGDTGNNSSVNRGVPAISDIPAHAIIGEYTGLFQPYQYTAGLEALDLKDEYNMDFDGPPEYIRGKQSIKKICTVTSEYFGNWTRCKCQTPVPSALRLLCGYTPRTLLPEQSLILNLSSHEPER